MCSTLRRTLRLFALFTASHFLPVASAQVFIGFASPYVEVEEAQGEVQIHLQSSGNNVQPLEVRYTTASGSALAGEDFSPFNSSVRFLPGQTNHAITILITRDLLDEADEVFYLRLTYADNPAYVEPGAEQCAILIRGRPPLRIARVNPSETPEVAVSWRASATNYVLESTQALGTPWRQLPGAPDDPSGPSLTRHLPATNSMELFRLQKHSP